MNRPRRDSRQFNGITVEALSQPTFATWGNSGIESDTGRGNQLSRTNVPASCGLAIMESSDEELRWTGRVVEADIDLCGG